MMVERMTDERVFALIESYGAHPDMWPEDEQAAAMARLNADPHVFADALAGTRAMDEALDGLEMPEPSDALMARLLADVPQVPKQRSGRFGGLSKLIAPQGHIWPAGAALASLVLGAAIGLNLAVPSAAAQDQDEAFVYAALGLSDYDSTYEEFE